jgi:hypothetical protein
VTTPSFQHRVASRMSASPQVKYVSPSQELSVGEAVTEAEADTDAEAAAAAAVEDRAREAEPELAYSDQQEETFEAQQMAAEWPRVEYDSADEMPPSSATAAVDGQQQMTNDEAEALLDEQLAAVDAQLANFAAIEAEQHAAQLAQQAPAQPLDGASRGAEEDSNGVEDESYTADDDFE